MKFLEPKFCKFFLGLANPRKSVFALGKETYGSPKTTYAALDQLEAWELIEVNSEVSNKKQLIVTITEKGRQAMTSIYGLLSFK